MLRSVRTKMIILKGPFACSMAAALEGEEVVYFSVPQEVHKYEQLGSNTSAGVVVVVVVVV